MNDVQPDNGQEPARMDELLFPLFEALRREKLPLGVSEYLVAVRCLRRGIGLSDPRSLLETLSLLWAGSRHDREVLEDRFRAMVLPLFREKPFPCGKKEAPDTKAAPEPKSVMDGGGNVISITHVVIREGASEGVDACLDPGIPFPGIDGGEFRLVPELPMGTREMTQIFRRLRRMQRTGGPEELDVDETVDRICETGTFTGPVFRPVRKNCASLLVMMDVGGSMEPFSLFTDRLLDSIVKGGMLGKVDTVWFRNCPDDIVFDDPYRSRPKSLDQVLRELDRNSGILVVSDAGAACGYFSEERCRATHRFARRLMELIRKKDCRFAWLNPVPKVRWQNTSAEKIAVILRDFMGGMFPITRQGLINTVDMIRGTFTGRGAHGKI